MGKQKYEDDVNDQEKDGIKTKKAKLFSVKEFQRKLTTSDCSNGLFIIH